jgi:DNA-binding NtrC family response regulator
VTGTIIVVEDDDDVRELAVTALREAGFGVLQAMNGGIALVLLEQEIPIDVLFTDIVMPGEPDGFELARRAIALRPGLKVLYTTGFTGAHLAQREKRLHGKILQKPYRPTQLVAQIDELVDGGVSQGA